MKKDDHELGRRLYKIISDKRNDGEADFKLAKRLGISPVTFHGWKNGQTPKIEALIAIAEALDLDPTALFSEMLSSCFPFMESHEKRHHELP